ncbi:YraN family protein [Agromyces aerolatus]|uniref:YraN family protein n=1 Tax=Agromyces sp. LY-1074 TaxID=3074080 RepID=UPI00286450CF|nr:MULTISPECIES: YraN family protein [unclassified Agromyces]MDR5699940.1 YraN family protein [Agromyces sp. LY-1074]MDR5706248.1 YraN family protein [Agromyces sp. LY-1358]
MAHNTELGRRGEDLAAAFLEGRGMQIVARNWRCQHGEIDLVARDGRDTVIVEVKTRRTDAFGHPFEAITPQKLGRLRRLAAAWCRRADGPTTPIGGVRIDAVAVLMPDELPAVIDHLEGVQ